MADLTNEELQAMRRLCNRSGQPLDGDEDGFECDGCKRLLTRCACPDIAFEALPHLLDEVERLRAGIREFVDYASERQGKAFDESKVEFIGQLLAMMMDLGLAGERRERMEG